MFLSKRKHMFLYFATLVSSFPVFDIPSFQFMAELFLNDFNSMNSIIRNILINFQNFSFLVNRISFY